MQRGSSYAPASPAPSISTPAGGCTAKTIPERGFGDVASILAGTSSESDERVGSFWDKYTKVSRKTAVTSSSGTDWPSPAEVPCKAEEDLGTNQLDNKAASAPPSHTPEEREMTARTRLQCHLLLLGGTGTGKSTLLLSAKKLMPRVCTTTGTAETHTCRRDQSSANGCKKEEREKASTGKVKWVAETAVSPGVGFPLAVSVDQQCFCEAAERGLSACTDTRPNNARIPVHNNTGPTHYTVLSSFVSVFMSPQLCGLIRDCLL